MNPEISRRYGEQHRAELHRQAERRRVAAQLRRPKPARLAMLRAVGPPMGRLPRGGGAAPAAQARRRPRRSACSWPGRTPSASAPT